MSDIKFQQLRSVVPHVSRETFLRLLSFETLFLKWSKAYNLASPSTLGQFWERHILDSAQVFSVKEACGVWLDIGSGGGLPGIVEGIFMAEKMDGFVHLIESNGKKASFLRSAIVETGAKAAVHCVRIEDAVKEIGPIDVVSARALAPLDRLLAYSYPWISRGATGVFHKGREFRQEIKVARGEWHFNMLEHKSMTDSSAVLLEINSLQSQTQKK
jgi:16S rRNA (guanine527-N7)-methyltransferase